MVVSAYALPMAVLPGVIQDGAGLPKLAVLTLTTALLCGTGLARTFLYREPLCPASPLTLPLLALLVWAALSLVNTTAPGESLQALLCLGALLTATLLASSLPGREPLMNAVMISAGLVALYGICQYMGFEPLSWSPHFGPRIFATLGNPVFLGGFMAAVFPLAFARWLYTEREEVKDLLVWLLAALAIAAYLTWTRSAWLALACSTTLQLGILMAGAPGRRLLAANRTWLLTGVVLGVIAVTLISSAQMFGKTPVPLVDRVRDALNPKAYSAQFRRVTGEVCLRLAAAHPFLGSGLGSYSAQYPFLRLSTKTARAAPNRYFHSQERYAHNDHLQILGEAGVLGFGIWIWLLTCVFRWSFWLHGRDHPVEPDTPGSSAWYPLGAMGAVAAVCVDGALNFPLHNPPIAWVFFLTLGLLSVGCGRARAPAPRFTGRQRWRGVAAAALIIICGLAVGRPIYHTLDADRWLMLGDRQVSYNNYEMAGVYYGAGVRAAPLNKFLRFRYSVAIVKTGRWEWQGEALDLALNQARRALALGYHDENVYKHISDIFGKKTDYPKAIRALEISYQLNPQQETVANNLAYYLAERGDHLQESLRLARAAVSRAPEDPTYLDTLGYVLAKAGQFDEAKDVLEKALNNLPRGSDDPRVSAARAEILTHLRWVRRRSFPERGRR